MVIVGTYLVLGQVILHRANMPTNSFDAYFESSNNSNDFITLPLPFNQLKAMED